MILYEIGHPLLFRHCLVLILDEAPQFDQQWRDATRRQHAALGYRRDRHDRRHKAHRSRAIKGT